MWLHALKVVQKSRLCWSLTVVTKGAPEPACCAGLVKWTRGHAPEVHQQKYQLTCGAQGLTTQGVAA